MKPAKFHSPVESLDKSGLHWAIFIESVMNNETPVPTLRVGTAFVPLRGVVDVCRRKAFLPDRVVNVRIETAAEWGLSRLCVDVGIQALRFGDFGLPFILIAVL